VGAGVALERSRFEDSVTKEGTVSHQDGLTGGSRGAAEDAELARNGAVNYGPQE
jgi:hypothetical protein